MVVVVVVAVVVAVLPAVVVVVPVVVVIVKVVVVVMCDVAYSCSLTMVSVAQAPCARVRGFPFL